MYVLSLSQGVHEWANGERKNTQAYTKTIYTQAALYVQLNHHQPLSLTCREEEESEVSSTYQSDERIWEGKKHLIHVIW